MTMLLTESDSTVRIEVLGEELRRLRELSGLTLAQVSERTGLSLSHVSRLETGKRAQSVEDVATLLVVYGVTGPERGDLIALAKKARQSGLWQRVDQSMRSRVTVLSLLESRAMSIASWEPLLVPGLLQTIPYAQALFREIGMVDDPEELDRRVVDRIHRQAVLRKPGAPKLTAFIGEAALRNPIGGKEVLYEQLKYLVEVAERGNVVIQVMPAAKGGHPGLDGSFLRLRFADRPAVVFAGCLCSSVYMEDRLEIAMFDRIVGTLRERALSEENSVRLIAELAANLEFSVA